MVPPAATANMREGQLPKLRAIPPEDGPGVADEHDRDSLVRWDLAAARHRIVLGRLLGLAEIEVLALQQLMRAGELTPSELGDLLQLSSGGVTALTRRLERAGYVARRAHPRDRRRALLRVTPAMRGRAAEVWAPLSADIDAIVARLSPSEREVIGDVIARLAQAIERHVDRLVSDVVTTERLALSVPAPGRWS
jgi:DNA-binding MarR family transcriptional regulator